MIATEKQFRKECENRGFVCLAPHYYTRCCGEGLYETIYTGFRRYHSPEVIEINPTLANHKSFYISISIRSLYWCWEEDNFVPQRDQGLFSPGRLLYNIHDEPPFSGITAEYRMMDDGGFDVLDRVKTQADLLELYQNKLNRSNTDRRYDATLIAPYLMCRNIFDASVEITRNFTQRMMNTFNSGRQLLDQGKQEEFLTELLSKMDDTKSIMFLWNALMGHRNDWLACFLMENYQRNMNWVEKYGIPVLPDYRHCKIPTDFFHADETDTNV